MNIVKVRYFIGENEMSSREYTYYSEAPLQVGDLVTVPVRNTTTEAKVSAIDVPESEIAAFKDKIKTIPAQMLDDMIPPSPHLSQPDTDIQEATALTEKVTALALTDPRHAATFIALSEKVLGLIRYAETRIIATDEDVKLATDDLGLIANLKKTIEDKRTGYVKPFNDHVKEVNGIYKLLSDPLDLADKINRQKVLNYRVEQERKRREAEEINRMREEAAKREAALNGMVSTESGVVNPATGEIVTPVEKVVVPEAPAAHVHGMAATMGTIKTRKWEVIDQRLVPEEYKIVDAVRIGKVVRAGIPSIPGIRIWEEDSLRITK